MIFVTVGSQKIPFDRLLKALDTLKEEGKIEDEILVQSGYCTYVPKYMQNIPFMSKEEFVAYISKAELLITHGGEGCIVDALKLGKKVIVVPRLSKYGEHVDDHQLEVPGMFAKKNYITLCEDPMKLDEAIAEARMHEYAKYESNPQPLIDAVDESLRELLGL